MSNSTATEHSDRVREIADQYIRRGYTVQIEPSPATLPFSLGTYRPDLVAQRDGENLVIEVKTGAREVTVDRYREIAEDVAEHEGWRFLLITGEDVSPNGVTGTTDDLPTWGAVVHRADRSRELLKGGDAEAAYLVAWSALEGLLRRRAEHASIPVERMPIVPLARHLYSQGELSAGELDATLATIETRNRLVHGFQAPAVSGDAEKLQRLIERLLPAGAATGDAA